LKRNNSWHYLQLGSATPQPNGTTEMSKTVIAKLRSSLFKSAQSFIDHNITTNTNLVIHLPNPLSQVTNNLEIFYVILTNDTPFTGIPEFQQTFIMLH
jgi:hypothetical protein